MSRARPVRRPVRGKGSQYELEDADPDKQPAVLSVAPIAICSTVLPYSTDLLNWAGGGTDALPQSQGTLRNQLARFPGYVHPVVSAKVGFEQALCLRVRLLQSNSELVPGP